MMRPSIVKALEVTVADRLFWVYNTVFHVAVALTSGFMFYIFLKYHSNYALTRFLHVFLCTLAYIPLMVEALLLFSEYNVWSLRLDRARKSWIHGTLLGSSFIIATIGISIKINSKSERSEEHFVSNHAILGLASWIVCFISVVGGVLSLYSSKLRNLIRPVILKLTHTFLGLTAFTLGMASLILGLDLPAFNNFTTRNEKIVITVLLSIITIMCGTRVIRSAVNQFKAILT
ncbi:unnamed protein product [Psylliodes chrysocephalus]|uniref:ascorbate ferrireductase (transmembrane) n=1 Tax=Psylliodes chrysocephalus TaxID=3402493 RepID=A0A9P0D6K0_9CUCU|nr:unnamed protein product [Psylliodes chrysocephala]